MLVRARHITMCLSIYFNSVCLSMIVMSTSARKQKREKSFQSSIRRCQVHRDVIILQKKQWLNIVFCLCERFYFYSLIHRRYGVADIVCLYKTMRTFFVVDVIFVPHPKREIESDKCFS